MEQQKELRVFELFAGYGGASFALQKANIPHKVVGYSEIDKHAIKCYDANHPNVNNYGDISKIDVALLPDFDLLTGGFPCTDVSIAGKRDLSKGRTTLFDHIIRIAKVKKPKWMILENVEGILSMPFKGYHSYHDYVIKQIKSAGYSVVHKLMNSKRHGTPQNRPRYIYVCKLGDFIPFEKIFPYEEPLKICLKDLLQPDVEDKYYISQVQMKRLLESDDIEKGFSNVNQDIAQAMVARQYSNWRGNFVAKISVDGIIRDSTVANCITAGGHSGGNHSDMDLLVEKNKCVELTFGKSQAERIYATDGTSVTLTSQGGGGGAKTGLYLVKNSLIDKRVRRLTPTECFRLQGFFDDAIILTGISDSQLYKLAGNGWDVNMFSKLFSSIKWFD